MSRVFIAINLPEEVKKKLEDMKQGIIDAFGDETGRGVAKWVEKDNLHITLLFVGNVNESQIVEIEQKIKLATEGQSSFNLKIEKVCYDTENSNRGMAPKLIWAEIGKSEALRNIAQTITKARPLGAFKGGPWKAHITLARIRTWQWKRIDSEERPDIEQNLDIEFQVKSIDIMESNLKPSGPVYSLLKKIILQKN